MKSISIFNLKNLQELTRISIAELVNHDGRSMFGLVTTSIILVKPTWESARAIPLTASPGVLSSAELVKRVARTDFVFYLVA